ncbi:MAG: hypothetical protein VX768_02070 [Planctomycetota bacterium]|nr:hypothetical protein [Planctomycetota bacterium]
MVSKRLLLVPTDREIEAIESLINIPETSVLHRCGFGLLESAIQTARLIQQFQPDSILLAGIAGSYPNAGLSIGSVYCFESCSQYGIGSWREKFCSASDLGFSESAPDSISLNCPEDFPRSQRLVSVTTAGLFQAPGIRTRYPDASAEDMEGYGVALTATSFQVPLTIIRSISNEVGQPVEHWKIDDALRQLADSLSELLQRDS